MLNVYKNCPKFENETYLLRLVSDEDCNDLLKVYSDEKSIPLFNSDNCGYGFHCTTTEHMSETIKAWHSEYNRHAFVRWTIIDKHKNSAIGTIELFNRKSNDYFNNCGILRLDLRSDYEKATEIKSILLLIVEPAFELFQCKMIATKAIPKATERIFILEELGFLLSNKKVIGHNGTRYDSYFVLKK